MARAARPAASSPRQRTRKAPARTRRAGTARAQAQSLQLTDIGELEALRARLAHGGQPDAPLRWNGDPEDVHRSVVRLVLTLVEFIRQLLERQAVRRMEAGSLTAGETEDIGRALMQLEATVRDLCARFDLTPDDLNPQLGPLGRLM